MSLPIFNDNPFISQPSSSQPQSQEQQITESFNNLRAKLRTNCSIYPATEIISNMRPKIEQLTTNVNKLIAGNQTLRDQMQQSAARLTGLEQTNGNLTEQLNKLNAEKVELEGMKQQLESTNAASKEENEQLTQQKTQLQDKIAENDRNLVECQQQQQQNIAMLTHINENIKGIISNNIPTGAPEVLKALGDIDKDIDGILTSNQQPKNGGKNQKTKNQKTRNRKTRNQKTRNLKTRNRKTRNRKTRNRTRARLH